jgi:hypothetical protein
MTADDSLLAQGIIAARNGDKSTARQILTQVIQDDARSEAAWLWLSAVLDTPQARAFCLHQVLALNPRNQTAQKGLASLEAAPPAPTIGARTPPDQRPLHAPVAPVTAERGARWRSLASKREFWQVTLLSLAAIAAVLVGLLLYAVLGGAANAQEEPVAVIVLSPTPWPRGTLRPTYTSTPTNTAPPTHTSTLVPTFTPIHTPTSLPTATSTHSVTPMPAATATPTSRPRIKRVSPTETAVPTATPCPAPVIRTLDGRLPLLGVRVEPASVSRGQPYWRLADAYWTDEAESGGKHSIYIEVLNVDGNRTLGQQVVVEWTDGSAILVTKDMPLPEYGVNFPMYSALGSYAVRVLGYPSDRICGLGLGTIDAPNFTIHTCFYLTFQLAYR